VNSGHRMSSEENQEENALKINMEAAAEIVRQLRLRDIGGIIVIDFIDMRHPNNKATLNKAVNDFMRADKARHTILPLSRFNLMQITRERVKPQVNIDTQEVCPTCLGSGTVGPSILLVDEIRKSMEHVITQLHQKRINLMVHPYIESHLRRGLPSLRLKWRWKYKCPIEIDSNESMGITEYKFFDQQGEEINLG